MTGRIPDVLVTLGGDLVIAGIAEWLSEMVHDERWRPGMKTLVDATALLPHDMTGHEVATIGAEIQASADDWGPGFSAVVVTDPAVYGLVRMWQAYTSDMAWETAVFHTRDEALEWLLCRSGTPAMGVPVFTALAGDLVVLCDRMDPRDSVRLIRRVVNNQPRVLEDERARAVIAAAIAGARQLGWDDDRIRTEIGDELSIEP